MQTAPQTREQLRALLEAHINDEEYMIESTVDGRLVGGGGRIIETYEMLNDLYVVVDWGLSWIVRPEGFRLTPMKDWEEQQGITPT